MPISFASAGFSGDDSPRLVIPAFYGISSNAENMNVDSEPQPCISQAVASNVSFASGLKNGIIKLSFDANNRYHVGDLQLNCLRAGMEVKHMFSQGKGTSLVVNLGHQVASVTPIIDGYVLHNVSFNERKFGGQYVTQLLTEFLSRDLGISVSIPQQIISKEKVELMTPPKAVLKPIDKCEESLLLFLKEVALWSLFLECDRRHKNVHRSCFGFATI
ncbi:hypothetical protein DI09_1p400 [Mitosporidium daphniae]|uniref:Uncharacterized protein n=1 Tax=Mitosporidium daphniae TaxID=1485682 RepID=A0A098VT83_9MICR|nr:uncharacterized protein DI09_1p400 [Mitosporidium daphniae]KGG52190.1 hypothetical protein DI09_1p400 [Mitosporidium daphniae]|eukprot:XP_013238617.1 uncharacterized protein DI09_1p400 [Mitosporidium daphniae]